MSNDHSLVIQSYLSYSCDHGYYYMIKSLHGGTKNSIKTDGRNHHVEDKREGQRKAKSAQPEGTKEGKELVPLMVGIYFTHNPSNVTYMQIISNSNRRPRASISHQGSLPFYSRS